MIEVEKKFLLTKEDEERLKSGAEFISKKTFTDIYYDDSSYSLTSNDRWLRNRAGRFELKIPLFKLGDKFIENVYDELETEQEIRNKLTLPNFENFDDSLKAVGYNPFCQVSTTRTKYKSGIFTIDMDIVRGDYDYYYGLVEIELMINGKSEIKMATEKITQFAKENGLKISNVNGKIVEYLRQKKPAHYRALVDCGVVKDF